MGDYLRNSFCQGPFTFAATGDRQTEMRLSEDCPLRGILFDEVFLTGPVFPEYAQYIS